MEKSVRDERVIGVRRSVVAEGLGEVRLGALPRVSMRPIRVCAEERFDLGKHRSLRLSVYSGWALK
jgi:hypothetical protein